YPNLHRSPMTRPANPWSRLRRVLSALRVTGCRLGRMRESRSRDHLLNSEYAGSGAGNGRASGAARPGLAPVALLAARQGQVEFAGEGRAGHPRIGSRPSGHGAHRESRSSPVRALRARITLLARQAPLTVRNI